MIKPGKSVIAIAAVAIGALGLGSTGALASHHFETALVRDRPAVNQLDNYVFASERPEHTVFIMNVNASPQPGSQPVFAADALYNIHVSSDDAYRTGLTFTFAFNDEGRFSLYTAKAPNGEVGALGDKIGEGRVGQASELANGIRVWTGVVHDPFFGNSPSLGFLRAQINSGEPYDPEVWDLARGNSIFVGRKSSAIVLEVPDAMLGSTIRVFMTTAIRQGDIWRQVQYSANPLFSHIMLFEHEALKESHNRSRPDKQNTIKPIVSARISRATTLAGSRDEPIRYGNDVADQLVPDVLTYETGSKAEYTASRRNGRALGDDAMSEVLTMLLGTPTDQKIADPGLYRESFPYIVPAGPE